MVYIYDRPDWPSFRWDKGLLATELAALRFRQGAFLGRIEALGFALRSDAVFQTLTEDVVKTSEIEGEYLDRGQVRSSLARRLGVDAVGLVPAERNVDGVVDMLLDATRNFAAPLTAERLFSWHAALFPTGRSGLKRITVGDWRKPDGGPMQVVSEDRPGRPIVHFQAPEAARIDTEMSRFLAWFDDAVLDIDPVIKAAVAHIWFETIHPFDDGNGRIGRAIMDMALARAEGTSQRFYSMSARLRVERNEYYETLEAAQKGDLDITVRLRWFLRVLDGALDDAEARLNAVLSKAAFWAGAATRGTNDRQSKILNRLLDGFEGKFTSSKYAKIAHCSQDTALRDIEDLIGRGLMVKAEAGGRSTSYRLAGQDHTRP